MKHFVYLIIVLLFSAVAAQAQTANALINQARKETDPAKKVRLLTQATVKAPQLAVAWHNRADVYREQGNLSAALDDYTKAISLTPKDPFRYYARGLAYMDGGKYTLAAADFTRAIALKKTYPDFYLHRAQANMKLAKYTEAAADYQKYLAKRPKTQEIALDLTEAYISTYQYPKAEEELAYLQQQEPDAPEAYFWRGRMLHNQGNLDEAVSFYSKALNRNSSFAPAYRYRAAAFKDMGELEASAEDYTQLVALTPEAIFYNRRGLVYEELEQWDKALADYNTTIELSPKWPIAYNNRGYVYLKQKKYAAARADFETAIKLDDSLPTPYINLAGLYWLQKKDRRNVYRNLDKAVKRNFRDFDALYEKDKKGWMFSGISNTAEFRAALYN